MGILASAEYMNGAINESLRLYPPGPNGMQRTVPSGGQMIQGELVPENTQVSQCFYKQRGLGNDNMSIHRSASTVGPFNVTSATSLMEANSFRRDG